jgi:hypothetical protein
MIKISIKKQEIITNQGIFETIEEGQSWLSYHEGLKTFGQPKQIVNQQIEISPAVFDEEGVLISEAQYEFQEVEIPAEYETIIEDISGQVAQEQINTQALQFLAESDWKVLRHIRQKALNQQLTLSEEEYLALEQQRSDAAASIVR